MYSAFTAEQFNDQIKRG